MSESLRSVNLPPIQPSVSIGLHHNEPIQLSQCFTMLRRREDTLHRLFEGKALLPPQQSCLCATWQVCCPPLSSPLSAAAAVEGRDGLAARRMTLRNDYKSQIKEIRARCGIVDSGAEYPTGLTEMFNEVRCALLPLPSHLPSLPPKRKCWIPDSLRALSVNCDCNYVVTSSCGSMFGPGCSRVTDS